MLRSLNRTLVSSTGCTVKHWMSVGVKEPQAHTAGDRGYGGEGPQGPAGDSPRGAWRGAAGPARGGDSKGNKLPSQLRPYAQRIHCPGEPVMSWPGGDVLFSFSALGKGFSSRISKSSRRSYSLPR